MGTVRLLVRLFAVAALLILVTSLSLSQMVDPAIDPSDQPFCYFSRPSTQIGVMDGRDGAQVTGEGYLYTGSAELLFFAGDPLKPTYQRIKTLVEGDIPIVRYSFTQDGVAYNVEMFAATLDGDPTSPMVDFVKIDIAAAMGAKSVADFAVGYCWRGPNCGVRAKGAFMPFNTYWLEGNAAGRNKDIIYLFQGPKPVAHGVTLDDVTADPTTALRGNGKDLKILADTPTCITRYSIDLSVSKAQSIIIKVPHIPLSLTDTKLRRAIEDADYNTYRERTIAFWHGIDKQMTTIDVDEPKVVESYKASVMYALCAREKIDDQYVQTVNQLQYNDFYLRDCAYIVRGYDVAGLNDIARQTAEHFLKYQQENGNFESQGGQLDGWGQAMWTFGSHFRITGDMDFARKVYPTVPKAVDWLTKTLADDPWHLMPVCGPYDNEVINGRYTGHNFLCLLGLREAAHMATALGKSDDAKRYQAEHDALYATLMAKLTEITAKTNGYIPPGLDVEGGQEWGNLECVYPTGVLPADHPWVTATWKRMRETKMVEGVMSYWGAIHSYLTADLTETSIIRGDQQDVLSDLYGMLLHTDSCHASFEWGIAGYGNRDLGDNYSPHGWGHMKLVAVIRDMLVREQDKDLHILSAVSPQWVGDGKNITIANAPTEFGKVGYTLACRNNGATLSIDAKYRTKPERLVVHVPWYVTVSQASADGKPVTIEKDRIVLDPDTKNVELSWTLTNPDISFDKTVTDYKAEYARRYKEYVAEGKNPLQLTPDAPKTIAERTPIYDERFSNLGIAVGKPVTVVGESEGNNIPERAIDGMRDDVDAGWWGVPTPVTLTVDLEQPSKIRGVDLWFFWNDERYYQYTVEVSDDNQTWRQVVDASNNTKRTTIDGYHDRFDPVTARYIRVTVLKNSANPTSHLVEFKVIGVDG